MDLLKRALVNQRALIASNAASFPYSGKMLKPERAVSTFPKFIELALKSKVMTLQQAIKKITIDAAKKMGIENRGLVKEGYFADLVLFSIDESEELYGKYMTIKAVTVNGMPVLEDEIFKKQFPGKTLKFNSK